MSLKTKRQDRQTQRMFDNVTKNLLDQGNGLKRDPETGVLYEEPLKEEHPIGSLLLLRGAGPAAAKGLEFIGEKMMPSALLKGVGQTFPKLAKATTAISPYADAGLLAAWGAQGIQSAKEAAKSGDAAGVIAGTSMAALPLIGINPEVVQELKSSQKVNNIARALNREVKGTEIVDSPVTQNILAGKLGWAPGQSRVIWHNSESPISKLESTFPAWDTVERGAPLGHVWGTGSETNLGFIGKRPFHLRSTKPVEMNKPMVQLNESIGSGKNAVRNEILKFADQSGADAINFSNIKDNTLSNQDVYAVLKDVDIKPKLSEAERLGIPKGERSNPKALEDPQYWGYKQWNDRYNAAVESGNWDEAQRLRDLHFKTKAPNTKVIDENGNPLHMYHGIKPKYKRIGTRVPGSNNFDDQIYWDKPVRFTKFRYINFDLEDLAEESKRNWVSMKKAVPNHDTMNGYHTRSYETALRVYGRNNPSNVLDNYLNIEKPFKWDAQTLRNITGRSEASDWADFGWDRKKLMELGYDGLFIPQYHDSYGVFNSPAQIKSADPITWNGKGEIIPIVKRDNFHNLDMRYKQGGILKGRLQNNKELI